MKIEKDISVSPLTEKEKEAVREMLENLCAIKKWKWSGMPFLISMVVSMFCGLGIVFAFLTGTIEPTQKSPDIAVFTAAGVCFIFLSTLTIIGTFLLHTLLYKPRRNRKIQHLHSLYRDTPEAKSAIIKIKFFLQAAESFEEFYLSPCEHIQPNPFLEKLLNYRF